MKKGIMLTLCILFAALTIGTAQNNNDKKCDAGKARCTEMAKKATKRMKAELSLTDEQAAKLEELNKEYMPKMRMAHPHKRPAKGNHTNNECKKECAKQDCKNECAKQDCKKECSCCKCSTKCDKKPNKPNKQKPSKANFEQRHNEMKAMRKAYNEKLNEILTPEQQEKYKSLRKERKEKKGKK